jgi:inhibitor of cysteine peptidase
VQFAPWLTSAPSACQAALSGIQGRVARPGDTPSLPDPIPGVTLVLSNGDIVQTNQNGNFAFSDLPPGQYTVQPFLNGYSFTPPTWVVNLPPSATGLAFVGSPVVGQTYSVQGRVVDRQGNGVGGVTLLATAAQAGGIAVTDANGYYSMTGVLPGAYTLTALLAGYTFDPASRAITVSGNMTGQDFVRRNLGEGLSFIFVPLVGR